MPLPTLLNDFVLTECPADFSVHGGTALAVAKVVAVPEGVTTAPVVGDVVAFDVKAARHLTLDGQARLVVRRTDLAAIVQPAPAPTKKS